MSDDLGKVIAKAVAKFLGTMIGVVVLLIGLVAVFALLHGFVLMKLWGWFIVPTFKLPPLSIAPAIGLGLVVGILVTRYPNKKMDEQEKTLQNMLVAFLIPIITLMMGYIVHLFM